MQARYPLRKSDLLCAWDFLACGLVLPCVALFLSAAGIVPVAEEGLLARLPFAVVIVATIWRLARTDDVAESGAITALHASALHVLPVAWLVWLTGRAGEVPPGLFLIGWLTLAALFLVPRRVLLLLGRWPLRS